MTWKQVKNIAHISGAAQTELKVVLTRTEGQKVSSSKRKDGRMPTCSCCQPAFIINNEQQKKRVSRQSTKQLAIIEQRIDQAKMTRGAPLKNCKTQQGV